MPKIPGAEALGGAPSARSGRAIATVDTSAVPAAVESFGRQVAEIGNDLITRRRKQRALEVEKRFQDFAFAEAKTFEEATKNLQPGAPNFASSYAEGYKRRADAFAKENLKGLTPEVRADFDGRLFKLEQGAYFDAAKTERVEQSRYGKVLFEDGINNSVIPRVASASNPEAMDSIVGDAYRLIDSDPDLTPIEKDEARRKARERIEAAYLAKLTPEERIQALTGGSVTDRIIGVESNGRSDAKNQNSSAEGPGQFIDSTWLEVVGRHRPDLLKGRTRAEVLALRRDGGLAREMVSALAAENAQYLGARGYGATPGNIYLAHFLGPSGAAALLGADANEDVGKLLRSDQINANASILRGKTAGQVIDWAAQKMGEAKAATRFTSITPEDRLKLIDDAEREEDANERELERIAREGRAEIEKEGADLSAEGALTMDWLQTNRENLSASSYKAFLRELTPGETPVKTDPKDYLALLDLAASDPAAAIAESREAYGNARIDRDTFNKIQSTAQSKLDGEEAPPYVRQVRQYVSNIVSPPPDGSRAEFARALDTMFIFDDWAKANPKATREEARSFADDLIVNNKKYVRSFKLQTTPLPMYLRAPSRDAINLDELNKAKARTSLSLQLGGISDAQAAEQAKILRDWYDLIGGAQTNGR